MFWCCLRICQISWVTWAVHTFECQVCTASAQVTKQLDEIWKSRWWYRKSMIERDLLPERLCIKIYSKTKQLYKMPTQDFIEGILSGSQINWNDWRCLPIWLFSHKTWMSWGTLALSTNIRNNEPRDRAKRSRKRAKRKPCAYLSCSWHCLGHRCSWSQCLKKGESCI